MPTCVADFEILAILGQGSFGVIYKVRRRVDDGIYVLKEIKMAGFSAKEQNEASNEARILATFHSPHIVQYHESFFEAHNLYIVMEFCANGDLYRFLKSRGNKLLPETLVWTFFLQILLGMQHVHANKILHRDLKTMNLFLDAANRVKIGDLGVARLLGTHSLARTVVGTPYYLSPELCKGEPYDDKSDVWALGCILYELITLRPPFTANNQCALILKIIKAKYDKIQSPYSNDLASLVKACLAKEARRRPTVAQMLQQPAVQKRVALAFPPKTGGVEKFVDYRVATADVANARDAKGGGSGLTAAEQGEVERAMQGGLSPAALTVAKEVGVLV
jgi:NIMA (never in mitosis gene a)-related kinase